MAEETIKKTEAVEAPSTEAPKAAKKAKKGKRIVTSGQMHIKATFNNTIVTFSDKTGGVISSSSAGANGFRGSKKGTAYAAQIAAEKAGEIAKKDHGMNSVDVYVKGIGLGRDSAIRAVSTVGMKIDSITDMTPIAHGGVRPKGERKP
ncbi:30S ribosomal protein S11 [Candidatus Saccharibacteria bacterium]|nr:30S ribosomal protein S11 [Candidatus Saccharibacteria bacterium]MBQ3271382.1 30S ribosomal protein S11 [Candidatus Saccharibacteria bacterium]MBR0415577.1 30S ribosomal protein S11 [Candidatus Saccharibacteria bacterium]